MPALLPHCIPTNASPCQLVFPIHCPDGAHLPLRWQRQAHICSTLLPKHHRLGGALASCDVAETNVSCTKKCKCLY
ncbi:hypothetical protein GDO81_029306 [Engystomops pustulosus]|uniref:Uncharacterized protein n=1 Tax=Engystomops pustulosus TaxID=76066 RepID=A0AAV6ZI43_ENGPU|nr:hypothetical protein GDO81_029306 [Engystomops pustulosus]